jgi:hypothetical protein
MGVTGWNYPAEEGLRNLIEKYKLYPVTILSSLSGNQKQLLLENHFVSIGDILQNQSCLDLLEIQNDKKELIIKEVMSISG